MFGVCYGVAKRRAFAIGAGLAILGAGATALATTEAQAESAQPTHEIIVTVKRFKALDKADELSSGDFFARTRINGKAAFSPVLSGQNEFKPDWTLTLPATAGVNEVNLALVDKDVSVDDPIDINRLPNKRDLDFTVNTRTGRIEGFSQTYKVGQTITRAGAENKRAEISFIVTVKKK